MQVQNKPLSNGQLKAISAIVGKLKIDKEDKAAMVQGFSAGRTQSSKELYMDEARAMIQHLNGLRPGEVAAAKMRNKIIYLAYEMGWTIPAQPKPKADMKRITGWCKTYGYPKKDLDNYTLAELPKLVTQMVTVYEQFLSKF